MKEIIFKGVKYVLNQCEPAEGIWEWFRNSKVGEFTHYYSRTIFHTANGFWAGYNEDLENGCFV